MLRRPRIVTDITSYSLLYAHNTAVLCVTVCVTFGLIVAASHFITVNTSASASPVGVYLRTSARIVRGQLVEVCLPTEPAKLGIERGYLAYSLKCADGVEPVDKVILGVPGDTIFIDPVLVLAVDTAGRPIGHFPFGFYQLKANENLAIRE